MNFFKSFGIVILVVLGLIVWSSTFIVDERKKALVLRFGEINRIVEKPGLYFKIPVADEVVPIEDRMILWSSDNMSVQVVDGRRYLVDAVTMARIVNAQRFRETVGADLSRQIEHAYRDVAPVAFYTVHAEADAEHAVASERIVRHALGLPGTARPILLGYATALHNLQRLAEAVLGADVYPAPFQLPARA